VSVQRGYDLRDFTLIAYGGAGPVHAGSLARAAGIGRVLVPAHSGAFSALGCLVSPLRYDAVRTYRGRLEAWDAKPAENRLRELAEQCVAPLIAEGVGAERIDVQWSADLRYSGQNYEIEVAWRETPEALRAKFEARHRRLYGYATGESVECVNLRVLARVPDVAVQLAPVEPAGAPGVIGEHRAHFPDVGEVALPHYDRGALVPGRALMGPALIEDEWSTILVYPGQHCTADRLGNLVIEI
jgi:N-methylhydantoinase A